MATVKPMLDEVNNIYRSATRETNIIQELAGTFNVNYDSNTNLTLVKLIKEAIKCGYEIGKSESYKYYEQGLHQGYDLGYQQGEFWSKMIEH